MPPDCYNRLADKLQTDNNSDKNAGLTHPIVICYMLSLFLVLSKHSSESAVFIVQDRSPVAAG